MTQYRKKPVVIEAEPYKPGMEDGFKERYIDHLYPNETFGIQASEDDTPIQVPYIVRSEWRSLINCGDWIITCANGDRYTCKADIFEETYELVE